MIDADYLHSAAYNRAHSPFLRLPAEIRNQIYHYLLHGVYVQVESCQPLPTDARAEMPGRLNSIIGRLAMVSTQIKQETKLLPFRLCRFRVSSLDFKSFLRRIGRKKASLIRELVAELQAPQGVPRPQGIYTDCMIPSLDALQIPGNLQSVVLIQSRACQERAQDYQSELNARDHLRRGLLEAGYTFEIKLRSGPHGIRRSRPLAGVFQKLEVDLSGDP